MPRLQIILVCLMLGLTQAFAQTDSTKLLYAKKFDSDAFVELGSQIMQFNGNAAMNIDFSANWLVQHKYYLGVCYTQLANVEQFYSAEKNATGVNLVYDEETTIKYQSAGIRFGYLLFHDHKIISFSPDLSVSWAGVKLLTKNEEVQINSALLAPSLKAVFNVSDYFRIGVGLNYNVFVFGSFDSNNDDDLLYSTQLEAGTLSGVGGGVFFRIGKF